MISEIRKSISSTLYERATSPLFGAFILSWAVWNWRIIMVVFFTEASELEMTKHEYIGNNLLDYQIGLYYPVFSTIIIILIYPFLSILAYWVWLLFEKWKNNIKNRIEGNKLLTLEQSMKLRKIIKGQDEQLESIINEKDNEIELLKDQNNELLSIINMEEKEPTEIKDKDEPEAKDLERDDEMDFFLNSPKSLEYFESLMNDIENGNSIQDKYPEEIIRFFYAYDLIQKSGVPDYFTFTKKGIKYFKEYYIRKG